MMKKDKYLHFFLKLRTQGKESKELHWIVNRLYEKYYIYKYQ
jgi:hypothetical protein